MKKLLKSKLVTKTKKIQIALPQTWIDEHLKRGSFVDIYGFTSPTKSNSLLLVARPTKTLTVR